jgi:hypothetical protein
MKAPGVCGFVQERLLDLEELDDGSDFHAPAALTPYKLRT